MRRMTLVLIPAIALMAGTGTQALAYGDFGIGLGLRIGCSGQEACQQPQSPQPYPMYPPMYNYMHPAWGYCQPVAPPPAAPKPEIPEVLVKEDSPLAGLMTREKAARVGHLYGVMEKGVL